MENAANAGGAGYAAGSYPVPTSPPPSGVPRGRSPAATYGRAPAAAYPAAGAPAALYPTAPGGSSVPEQAQQLAGSGAPLPLDASLNLAGAAKIQAMTKFADSVLGKPYIYGGGHGGWGPQPGYDCSGFVSAVLHAGGYLNAPVDTTALPDQAGIVAGPGQFVTIFDRALPGENGHVIIRIDGQFYESGGMKGPWGGGGGVMKIEKPSAAYLATFPNVLHPQGL